MANVCDVREGQIVRLRGRVRCIGEPLIAPLSGRRCAHYHLVVTDHGEALRQEHKRTDFLLDDGTGKARIAMDGATVDLTFETQHDPGIQTSDENLERFLAERGLSRRGLLPANAITCLEGVIEVDERVTVLGQARLEADPDPDERSPAGYRNAPVRPVIVAPRGGRVIVSDDRSTVRSGAPQPPAENT